MRGQGCKKCRDDSLRMTFEEFEKRSREIHGDRYNYFPPYITNGTKVKIECKEHGFFWQVPTKHWSCQGCPQCTKYSYRIEKPATLYYIRIIGTDVHKIGITNKTVESRFSKEKGKFEIIKQLTLSDGKEIQDIERRILRACKEFRYTGEPIFTNNDGYTEMFYKDILPEINNLKLLGDHIW